jgi:hypothetical protein
MLRYFVALLLTVMFAYSRSAPAAAQPATAQTSSPYKVLRTAIVGGDGNFDYIFADVQARRLYTPRSGPAGHLAVFNLDTLAQTGQIDGVSGGGATVD